MEENFLELNAKDLELVKQLRINKLTIVLFALVPFLQVVPSVIYFTSYKQYISSVMFIVGAFLVSIIMYKVLLIVLENKNNYFIKLSLVSILLLLIDQIQKALLLISNINLRIIGDYFQIKQMRNYNQNSILNYLDLGISKEYAILLKICVIILPIVFFIKTKNSKMKIGLMLLIVASVASLVDTILRGYVLDSIYYFKLFCLDIKDYYIQTAVAIIIAEYFEGEIRKQKDRK